MDQIIQTVEPVRQFAKFPFALSKGVPSPTKKNSKRSLLQPPLDSPSWDSSDFSSNSSTFPSTTSLLDRRLFILLSLFCLIFFQAVRMIQLPTFVLQHPMYTNFMNVQPLRSCYPKT